ncbi:MAG: hypothetical protein WCR46_22365 [Deltaproteobacteria bacterium]
MGVKQYGCLSKSLVNLLESGIHICTLLHYYLEIDIGKQQAMDILTRQGIQVMIF